MDEGLLTEEKLDAIFSYYCSLKLKIRLKASHGFMRYPNQVKCYKIAVEIFKKLNIDPYEYFDWAVEEFVSTMFGKRLWPSRVLTKEMIKKFLYLKSLKDSYSKIVEYFKKSCKTLSNLSNKMSVSYTDTIKEIIKNQSFSIYLQTGELSKYWIVTLGKTNIKRIIRIINDPNAQEILKTLLKNYDKVYSDVYDAFAKVIGKEPHPVFYISKFAKASV